MRSLLKFSIPVEKGNQAINDGSLAKVVQDLLGQIKPEAAYFTTIDGKRTALVVFDLSDPSAIPSIGEPLFMNLNASVELIPVMNAEDLMKGLSQAGLSG